MRRFFLICVIVFFVAFTREARSELATFVTATARDAESGEGESNTASLITSATFSNPNGGSASASASVGPVLAHGSKPYLAMKAFATATGGSGEQEFVGNHGSAAVFWDEVMTFRGDGTQQGDQGIDELMQYIKFVFHVDGSRDGDTLAGFEFALTNPETGDSLVQEYPLVLASENVPFLVFRDNLSVTEIEAHLSFSLSVDATGHGSGFAGKPNSSTADYSHTITLTSIGAYDANGSVIPGLTIQSESGFDYNPAVVPEPLSATLAAMGFFYVTFASRLTRRNRVGE